MNRAYAARILNSLSTLAAWVAIAGCLVGVATIWVARYRDGALVATFAALVVAVAAGIVGDLLEPVQLDPDEEVTS